MLKVLYHHAKFGVARISPAAGGRRKTLSFLSVHHAFLSITLCLSVTLLNVRVCSPDFAMKALENRCDFDAVG